MPHCNCSKNLFYYYGLSLIVNEVEPHSTLSGRILFVCAVDCYDVMKIRTCIENNIEEQIEHVVIISDIFNSNIFSPLIKITLFPTSINKKDVMMILSGGNYLQSAGYKFSLNRNQIRLASHHQQHGNVLKSTKRYTIKCHSLYYHKYSMMLSLGINNSRDFLRFLASNNLDNLIRLTTTRTTSTPICLPE